MHANEHDTQLGPRRFGSDGGGGDGSRGVAYVEWWWWWG